TTVHDTRQPITAIRGLQQLALRSLSRAPANPAVDEARNRIQRALAEVDRMEELLATLAEVSQLSLGRLDLQPEPCDLAEIVQETVGRLLPTDAARVQVEVEPGLDSVGQWDRRLLARVIGNLLSNAMKYSPEDSGIEVTLTRASDTQSILLSIADHGIG